MAELHTTPLTNRTYCMQFSGIYSLSLVGRGFFSLVSVFFSLVLSNLAISVRSGLSDMLAVNRGNTSLLEIARLDLALYLKSSEKKCLVLIFILHFYSVINNYFNK